MRFLSRIFKTLRLALPKIGLGWMFALLTSNFNRIAIHDLGIAAVLVTAMLSLHYFLSPFQVVFGRLADRHPLFGLRRTPYVLLGSLVASLVFLVLPTLAQAMSHGSILAVVASFGVLTLFGIGIATVGDAHHALIAEVTPSQARGGVIAVVWTVLIVSGIASAIVIKVVMGDTYAPATMQALYNLTPFIVMGSALLGLLGIEPRFDAAARAKAAQARAALPDGNPLAMAVSLLRGNPQIRMFFAFMLLSMLGIFLQDAILEVFGADVFGMTLKETTTFTQTWGGGVLAAMIVMGVASVYLSLSKKLLAMLGGAGTALGLGLLTLTALTGQRTLLNPALLVMGISTGVFNVGALALMMDMTVDGATGLYMGLWGVAQALGTGFASALSGGLKSALIETHLLSPAIGYTTIFGFETVVMLVSVAVLRAVNVAEFRGLVYDDIVQVMEATAAT